MPNTHDVGPFFVHAINLKPKSPLLHTAFTQEIEPPYRTSRSLVLKMWPGKGLVFGRWFTTRRTEEYALLQAIGGRRDALSTDEIRDNSHRFDEDPDDLLT